MLPYSYCIKRQKRKSITASYNENGDLIIKTPLNYPISKIDYFIEKNAVALWHLKQKISQKIYLNKEVFNQSFKKFEAIKIINQRFSVISEQAKNFDLVTNNEPLTKIMISKWGYCKNDKTICFNLFLGLLPVHLIDCVIAHELCHLKEMNHSKRFYDMLLKLYPNYKECDKELKSYVIKK
jgi:hypothetical protein